MEHRQERGFHQDRGGTSSESGPETRQGVWILGWKWIRGGLGALQPDRSPVLSKGPILPGRERSLSPSSSHPPPQPQAHAL